MDCFAFRHGDHVLQLRCGPWSSAPTRNTVDADLRSPPRVVEDGVSFIDGLFGLHDEFKVSIKFVAE